MHRPQGAAPSPLPALSPLFQLSPICLYPPPLPHSLQESINLTIYNIDAPQLSSLAQFISPSSPPSLLLLFVCNRSLSLTYGAGAEGERGQIAGAVISSNT